MNFPNYPSGKVLGVPFAWKQKAEAKRREIESNLAQWRRTLEADKRRGTATPRPSKKRSPVKTKPRPAKPGTSKLLTKREARQRDYQRSMEILRAEMRVASLKRERAEASRREHQAFCAESRRRLRLLDGTIGK